MEPIKKIIRSLLTANPTALTIHQLNKDYINIIGEPIPYQKYGYNSLEHFLLSIPDTLQVQGRGSYAIVSPVISDKSSHVMEMVSRQKLVKKRGGYMKRMVVSSPNDFFKGYKPPTVRSQSQKIVYPGAKSTADTNANSTKMNNQKSDDDAFKPLVNSFEASAAETQLTLRKPHFVVSENIRKNSGRVENITKKIENMEVSKKVPPSIQNLNKSHMPTYSTNSTGEHNESTTSSGRTRMSIFKKKFPSTVDSEEQVPLSVRNNLKTLIKTFPDGIWCAELLGTYRKMFKRELKYQDLGFRNLIDLCTCLKSVFHFVRPSTEDFKLYDRSKPLPASAEKNFTAASYSTDQISHVKQSETALPSIDWSDILVFLPEDIVKPGREIPRTFVPATTQENDTLDVRIGEIFDVSKFWIYRDDDQLDVLMDEMQTFYEAHAEKYKIPQTIIREGLYCVCNIFDEYHRAIVVNISCMDSSEVQLFYIDYGTIKREKVELYFLCERFATLPAQTIRCRLAGICPPEKGAPWSWECTKEFKELIKRKKLTAKINRINWKDQYLELFLADVTDSRNVFYINNVLVEKGYAIFPDQEQKTSIVDSISSPIVNLIHLFPTFLELENGVAPSPYEMEIYNGYDIPIHFCYPQYFVVDYGDEQNIINEVTNFYETNILKHCRTDLHHDYCVDVDKIKDAPVDASYFKDLKDEMAEYVSNFNRSRESDRTTSNDNSIEDESIRSMSDEIEVWKNELKKGCILSENIMQDILDVCRLTDGDPLERNEEDSKGESNCSYCSGKSEISLDDGFSRVDSLDSLEYPTNKSDETSRIVSSSASSNKSDVNHASETNMSGKSFASIFHPSNPFLSNCLETDRRQDDILNNDVRLHPTNPFLNYISGKNGEHFDEESDSSSSTTYGACMGEFQIQSSWSTIGYDLSDRSVSHYSSLVDSTSYNAQEPKYSHPQSFFNAPPISPNFVDAEVSSAPPSQPFNSYHQTPNPPNCPIATSVHMGQSANNPNPPLFYPQNYYRPVVMAPFYPYPYHQQPYNTFYANNAHFNLPQRQVNGQFRMTSSFMRQTVPTNIPPNVQFSDLERSNNLQPDFYESYNEMLRSKFNA